MDVMTFLLVLSIVVCVAGLTMMFVGYLAALATAFGNRQWGWSVALLVFVPLALVYCLRHGTLAVWPRQLLLRGLLVALAGLGGAAVFVQTYEDTSALTPALIQAADAKRMKSKEPEMPLACELLLPDISQSRDLADKRADMLRQYAQIRKEAEGLVDEPISEAFRAKAEQVLKNIETAERHLGGGTGDLPLCRMSSALARDYVNELVLRIEDCGDRAFPKSDGKSLYGEPTIEVRMDRAGAATSVVVVRGSGIALLDEHGRRMVFASAPFGPVPWEVHENKFEQFVIRLHMSYFHEPHAKARKRPRQTCQLEGSPK